MIVLYKNGKRLTDWELYDLLMPTIALFLDAINELKQQDEFVSSMPDQPANIIFRNEGVNIIIKLLNASDETMVREVYLAKDFFFDTLFTKLNKFLLAYKDVISSDAAISVHA